MKVGGDLMSKDKKEKKRKKRMKKDRHFLNPFQRRTDVSLPPPKAA